MLPLNLPARLTPFLVIFLVLSALALQGCFHRSSGGGGSSVTPTSPVFTSGDTISVPENTLVTGYTAEATDADGNTVTFNLTGGEDQAAFSIDGDSGVLSFNTAPDFETPIDSDTNNTYVVEITATDGTNLVVQNLTVTVTDVYADPKGYYSNAGTASVEGAGGGALVIDDLQGMVDDNRIMMMSVTNELLYDGTITSINIMDDSTADFTADFTIYISGENPVTATASGTITAGSSITGTLTGNGVGNGQFTLLYAATNDQDAAVVSAWLGTGGGFDEFGFTIDGAGNLTHDESAAFNRLFGLCKMKGTVTPVSDTRLYSVNVELTNCDDLDVNTDVTGAYTGLATTRDDNTTGVLLVYAVSNGSYTLSGELNPD